MAYSFICVFPCLVAVCVCAGVLCEMDRLKLKVNLFTLVKISHMLPALSPEQSIPKNASCSDLSDIDLVEWMEGHPCMKDIDKDTLGMLRDLSSDKILRNTDGPFYHGSIGNDTDYVYGMHAVFSATRENLMVSAACKNMDLGDNHTLFVSEDDFYSRLPPRILSGDLNKCAMESYVVCDTLRIFENGQEITCKDGHIRNVTCDTKNVYISGSRIIDAFKYNELVIFVTENVLPFMWIDEHEKPRKHQVKDRRIRPAVVIHSFGFDEKEHNVHITITEPGCENFAFSDAVIPSTLDLVSNTRNMCDCNLTNVTIRHKPTHSGYNNKTFLNMSVREKRTKIDLIKIVHDFHMHNSGHTLPDLEKEWRKFDKTTTRNEETVENNTKETMTDHQFSNPPVARSLTNKKRRISSVSFKHEPPPPHATQLPHNSFSSIQQNANQTQPPTFSPLRATRNKSPTSPLDLHTERKHQTKCGKCFFGIDESDDFEYICDTCGLSFHYECTSLKNSAEGDFKCNLCL